MAVIQTLDQIQVIEPPWYQGVNRTGVRLYDRLNCDYATLYRVQPNARTCVDFLARNVAQLGLHQYERGDVYTDRVRLRDFGMTRLINEPMPPQYKVTRYRMVEAIVADLGIYFNAYLLKIRDEDGVPRALLRIPPQYVTPEGGLIVKSYEIRIGGRLLDDFEPSEIIHFRGYNPENPIAGLSPMETLRRVLAEEDSAGKYREELWQNSARMGGIIERPAEAPDWDETAQNRFLTDFAALYAGEGKGGKTAILEDGMKWVASTFSPRDSEYLSGRKLTREECARAYHIPLPMVGILDNATFSNIREQHKQLYQDSIGPILAMLEQDFDLQLLPDFEAEVDDINLIYSEFNILEKLQGDFEEQVGALQTAIGRPWMTPNEGRATLNLPSLTGDADQLATPLNVLIGGQASPTDSAPKAKNISHKVFSSYNRDLVLNYRRKWSDVLMKYFRRQERSVLSRIPPAVENGSLWWDGDRWNTELKEDLLALHLQTVIEFAQVLLAQTGVYDDNPDGLKAFEARLLPYLDEHSRIQAENTNRITEEQIESAIADPEPLEATKNVFNLAITARALSQAVSSVTFGSNFGGAEAARASNLVSKTWRVNSGNPRDTHAALDGVTVGIRELFSNGLKWPGDPTGSVDELAHCECSIEFNR